MTIPLVEFRLLALLDVVGKSGREVAQMYEEEAGSAISYGTLYTTFRRMKEKGWVEVEDNEDEDGRVRSFSITRSGKQVLALARNDLRELSGFGLEGA
jgi:DNA-binding PadR family transcriptional regulator